MVTNIVMDGAGGALAAAWKKRRTWTDPEGTMNFLVPASMLRPMKIEERNPKYVARDPVPM